MQLQCWHCAKTVSNHVPDSTVFRATATCPECEQKKTSPEPPRKPEVGPVCTCGSARRKFCPAHDEPSRKPEGEEAPVWAISQGEFLSRIDCLSMFVRRLYRKLRKYEPNAEVIEQANRYLRTIGQAGTPLRAEECEDDRKPEGDAGQTESNALRAAAHRRALESQRAERAEEQVRQLTAKLASRAEAERELLEKAAALDNELMHPAVHARLTPHQRKVASEFRAAVAKYREAQK